MKRYQMSRRALLRGLGVPWRYPGWSIRVWGDEIGGSGVSSSATTRMAVLFSGCGFHSKEWWARGEGKAMELGKVLQPLENFKEQMIFIRGLYNAEALKGNIHSSQTGPALAPLASGGDIRSGTSVDQFVAQSLGTQTKLPSLVLGWRNPIPRSIKLLNALQFPHFVEQSDNSDAFGGFGLPLISCSRIPLKGDQSVLDAVLEDAGDATKN